MKAVVTGCNGFIGFNLCQELAKEGHTILGIDDLSSGSKENVVAGVQYERVKIQEQPHVQKLFSTFQPDVIFHLAAIPRVSYSVKNPYLTAEANVLGTVSILESVVKAGLTHRTRIVNTSSSSVYGGAEELPTSEDHPCAPKSPYALEKYQAEQWCRLFVELYDIDVISLRYFNVFGPHARFGGAYSTVLTAWLYHLYVDPTYEAFLEGDGSQTRDFCFVENVVQANILAGQRQKKFQGEAFNVAQGQSHTLMDCKEILEEISGRELKLTPKPPRVGDVKHTLADISFAQKELGYNPSTDFIQQVTTMAQWYEHHYPTN